MSSIKEDGVYVIVKTPLVAALLNRVGLEIFGELDTPMTKFIELEGRVSTSNLIVECTEPEINHSLSETDPELFELLGKVYDYLANFVCILGISDIEFIANDTILIRCFKPTDVIILENSNG